MAAVVHTLLFSILVSSSFFSIVYSETPPPTPSSINKWCDKTPYPETCKQFMCHGPVPKQFEDFRKMAIRVALEKAVDAQGITRNLGPKCSNERERAAWADCITLYEDTILQLNNTLDLKCTHFDAQTWISTALTNLETCRDGFVELGVSDFYTPLIARNVSQLICNTLALGNGSNEKATYNDGFPSWVSPRDRKLLQSGVPAANLVVAQDGSGNYGTVQAAIDAAASKRSGSGRFVIHVKQGVYKENVQIGKKVLNIMLVGDGIGITVITGSLSVVGGSTTFNSATVGKPSIFCCSHN